METASVQNQEKIAERRCKVEVEIYGEQYILAASAESEYVRQLADEIDARMRRTAEANPHLGPMRITLLTLLGLAADVSAIQSAIEEQERSLSARCLEIERDIEHLLGVA